MLKTSFEHTCNSLQCTLSPEFFRNCANILTYETLNKIEITLHTWLYLRIYLKNISVIYFNMYCTDEI